MIVVGFCLFSEVEVDVVQEPFRLCALPQVDGATLEPLVQCIEEIKHQFPSVTRIIIIGVP